MTSTWEHFKATTIHRAEVGLTLDLSKLTAGRDFYDSMEPKIEQAIAAMEALEGGAIANPDENRMVGHYWLRNASLAPNPEISTEIEETIARIHDFATKVHAGELSGSDGQFKQILIIGIGGSALGPQFVADALGQPGKDRMTPYFLDNTDPDGIDRVLATLDGKLGQTLSIVISKSGGTPETRNGMVEAKAAYERAGKSFARHAIAITGAGSKLDKVAADEGWIDRFPMWDWVGGRTSELATVGLIPAALQGIDIDGILAGARDMDTVTRDKTWRQNPAAMLALAWYHATCGRGEKDMVILPYKDRLMLFSKYLQQLVMESLGKALDLDGKAVNQGIAVYGNKGSTDQHAYVQQLRDGINNFFVTFIEVLADRTGDSIEVEPGYTAGDFLQGFYLGTRSALTENARESVSITVPDVSPRVVGMLIALYERTVGLYASLVHINAYHQPGVEAGKKAAAGFLDLNQKIRECLRHHSDKYLTAAQIAAHLGLEGQTEIIFKILQRLAANAPTGVTCKLSNDYFDSAFSIEST